MCEAPATAFTTENGAIGSRRITAIATMPFFASRRVMRFSRAPGEPPHGVPAQPPPDRSR